MTDFDTKAAAAQVMADVPNINVTNTAEAADWLRAELGRADLSGLFLRENLLVHTPRIGRTAISTPRSSDSKMRDRHRSTHQHPRG